MRTFSEGRLARGIAYLLNGAFLWSVVMGVGAAPAAAQIPTKGATTQSVAVMAFQNRTKLRPETLGAEAADAVAVELRDRLLLDVLPKADVALQMRDLGMTAPLGDGEMVRLATELDVGLVVAGEVRGGRIISTRDGRYAEVVLAVRLFDRTARADVNGALVSAVSPTSDASEDTLIQKALQQAAFTAVQQMQSRPTVTAMVLWSRADTVFLNVGTRGGMRPGLRLVAVRGGKRIGMAKVTEADAIGAYAISVEGPPLRTGDQMRAVYDLPTGLAPERVGVAREKRGRFETMAIAAAVFLGLGNFASRTRRVDEGDTTAPGFTAANIANGADFGISGYVPSFQPFADIQPRPAAFIRWDRYQGSERSRIIAYQVIRRPGETVDMLITEFDQRTELIDWGQNPPGLIVVEFSIDENNGSLAELTSDFTPWEPELDLETGLLSNPTWYEFVADNADDAGVEITEVSYRIGWFPSELPGDDYGGMYPGEAYQYQIRPLVSQQMSSGFWVLNTATEFSRAPNFVVGVAPAGVFTTHYVLRDLILGIYEVWDELPNPEVRGNQGTFFFYYPYGATDIVLQIARDPNIDFAPPNVLSVSVPPTPPARSARNVTSIAVDLSLVPGFTPLFLWRVSARNIFDTHPAWTYPDGRPVGFVYSRTGYFLIGGGASRAEMMHEQRQAMEAIRAARARLPRTVTTDRLHRAQ
jgi:hypothetical protein